VSWLEKEELISTVNSWTAPVRYTILWPPYITGQAIYIFILWFLSFFFFSSPNLSGQRLDVYHTCVNLECSSETCCARLAENTARKKSPKSRHLGTVAQLCRAISSQLKHISTIGKKLIKQQYLLHMSPQYAEFRPTSSWDLLASLGHPCKFQRVSRLVSVTARHSSSRHQPNFAALNRGRHLYSAGRPSRWALAHISSLACYA